MRAGRGVVIVLGIDSGSAWIGWCRLRAEGGHMGRAVTFRYLAGGKAPAELAAVVALITGDDAAASSRTSERRAELLAVEGVGGRLFPRKGRGPALVPQLLATSHVAGGIDWLAKSMGVECVQQPAAWWRQIVMGTRSPSDRAIAEVIPRLVRGWPRRSSAHVRDAAGMAIAAVWTRKRRAA